MRPKKFLIGAVALALTAATTSAVGTASASPPSSDRVIPGRSVSDNLSSPMAAKQNALLQRALSMKLNGTMGNRLQSGGGDDVVRVGRDQYVQTAKLNTDKIFVIIAQFGNHRHPKFQDTKPNGNPASDALTYNGPRHNRIPEPDRSVDNATLWQADYNKEHYEDIYFNRMAKYYQEQSGGRYSVVGDVNGWVKVPFNEARYGRDKCGDIVCANTWMLIRDAMAEWVHGQLKNGQSMAQIRSYLRTFDKTDRYDLDGDGNFNEPDGFIDHFQIVHAGGDQADGDLQQGSDAIWSHRWYAAVQQGGPGGLPGVDAGSGGPEGGLKIPNNPTGVWIGDYTIQPENGGLGVFTHEYGHDLGLPDLYDTSGNTGGAENSTGFWTLMSSGANIGDGGPEGIGDQPTDLGMWEKFQLGWLDYGTDYSVAFAGENSTHRIGPAERVSKPPKAMFVVLPQKQVPLNLGDPCSTCGTKFFYSGVGDDLNNTMTNTSVSGSGKLTAKVRYDIETDYDYAFVEASTDGGTSWQPVATNLSDTSGDQSGFNGSKTGLTGDTGGNWVDLESSSALPAGTNALRFRYQTDGGYSRPGFQVDNVSIGATSVGTAESDEGWAFDGFSMTTGSEMQSFDNYYVVENRQYLDNDRSLKTAYNFGFTDQKPNWVEYYPYQDGLLISYWDTSQTDNNVGDHPGQGLILPVDAHPVFYHTYDGQLARPRVLSFDSTFGLQPTDAITIHKDSVATHIPSEPAVKVFDDSMNWWFNQDQHASTGNHVGRYQPGWVGVNVPNTGTIITVLSKNYHKVYKVSVTTHNQG